MNEERDKKILEELEKIKKDYLECFSTDAGKRVLEDLKKRCYFEYSTFSKDAVEMAFREGIRSVYLHILRMMQVKEPPKQEVK